jgi:hypothetical protein
MSVPEGRADSLLGFDRIYEYTRPANGAYRVPEPGNLTQKRPNEILCSGCAGEYFAAILICESTRITIFGATLPKLNVGI